MKKFNIYSLKTGLCNVASGWIDMVPSTGDPRGAELNLARTCDSIDTQNYCISSKVKL